MLDSIFRFLFKYPALTFEQGDFALSASRSMLLTAAVVGGLAVAALVTYRGIVGSGPLKDRLTLMGLRLGVIAVLFFCLLGPTLVLRAAVPQQNFLGILIDDSRSMGIADSAGQPRTAFVQEHFAQQGAALTKALSDRFVLRYFRFSSFADRLPAPSDLKYEGTATRLAPALERARDELAGLPLAGLVVVSDGADTSETSLDEPIASLKARSIPVFTVGVGQERFDKDIQISRVETPRSTLKGTSLAVDVVINHTGFAGTTVPLYVEDDGRIVSSQEVKLPPDGESATVRTTFNVSEAGPRLLRFRVPGQTNEQVTQNNVRDMLVEVADRREKVLYLEGEPRSEVAFIRRAVQDDNNLQVVMVVRTAENKYFRANVSSPDEVVDGFPKTREELFAYRALILGSVEAAAFSPDQLRMLADFVSKRGGALLMLGGRRAFAEGGWAGTPVGEVLPVEFDGGSPRGANTAEVLVHLTVKPTRVGATYPVTQLTADEESSTARWDDLPAVTSVNVVSNVKRGATTLLSGQDEKGKEHVVLAYQRYGRGKSVAFPVQDSWIWKMDAKIPVEDTTHSTFWRRLIRWLVDGVPDNVSLSTAVERVEPGEPMRLVADVVDPAFVEVNDAHVVAEIVSPSGKTSEVQLEWTVSKDGEYRATYVPDEPGLYEIRTRAGRGDVSLGTNMIHARVSAGDNEYFDATMRASLLTRVAEETGGRFFPAATAPTLLPEAISHSGRGVTVVEERDLWDMPAILLLLLALIGAEWGYRRKRGLA